MQTLSRARMSLANALTSATPGLMFLAGAAVASSILSKRAASRKPPVAKRIPHRIEFGATPVDTPCPGALAPAIVREDPLFWLRDDDRKDPEVLAHLAAENAFTAAQTAHLRGDVEVLYAELLSRLKETDAEVPVPFGPWLYYNRMVKGLSYALHCRRPRTTVVGTTSYTTPGDDAPPPDEQILLDENALAAGHPMLDVRDTAVSPDHNLLAYSADMSGYETYTIRVKRVAGEALGSLLDDVLEDTDGSIVWGADASSFYYLTMDDQHRPCQVWRHVLGTPQSADEALFEENDESFWVGIGRSATDEYLIIEASSKTTSEVRAVPLTLQGTSVAGRALGVPFLIQERKPDLLYEVDHYRSASGHESFVITTNAGGAKNGKVCVAPLETPDAAHWRDLAGPSSAIKVDDVHLFRDFWVIEGREDGYPNLWLAAGSAIDVFIGMAGDASPATQPGHFSAVPLLRIPPPESVFVIAGGSNLEYDASTFRFSYSSPVTPRLTCEADAVDALRRAASEKGAEGALRAASWDKDVRVLKRKEAPNCNLADYATTRVFARSRDGRTQIPISLVWKPAAVGQTPEEAASHPHRLPAPAPMLLDGYGSYGLCIDMRFDSQVLSLLDRGVVFAVAHIRGGGEMGRAWYEDEGKLLTKWNTFFDFIDCAEHLLATGWAAKGRLACTGASAGGLLVGVAVNERPDLWAAVVSKVGFVDVMTTMADASIPLTVTEWEEWGNPHEQKMHDYMLSYSPIDNVRPQAYPPILLTAGLNDSRVAYWEPAKFAQHLRAATTSDSHSILLKTEMGAGHFSFSDRYSYLREESFIYAWLLAQLGVPVKKSLAGGAGQS